MTKLYGRARARASASLLAALSIAALGAPSSSSMLAAQGTPARRVEAPAPPPGPTPPEIRVLSNRADLVSGGDALIEILWPAGTDLATTRVTLNDQLLTNVFASRANGRYLGLVAGLRDGTNVLAARTPQVGARIAITNHPIGGPIISGAQVGPWTCTTRVAQPTPNNPDLGDPLDAKCNVAAPVYRYQYRTRAGAFAVYDPASPPPVDSIATTTTDEGKVVPYIVRIERGVINRGKYDLAYLADPADPRRAWAPWESALAWNGKLFWRFGSGCDYQRTQGTPGNVLDDVALSRGFMVASSEMTQYGTHCNDVTSAETVMMIKEHITERYGPIRFTMSDGGSGGAHQQHLHSANYPGLLQGIMPTETFQDTWTPGREFADCGLLKRYWDARPGELSVMQRGLIAGHRWNQVCEGPANINMASRTPFYIDPAVGCNNPPDQWSPTNPRGVRCALQDYQIAIFGSRDSTGYARSPLDNVGVQYGLVALKSGAITPEQFVTLNERIGGYDIDGQWQPRRMRADPGAVEIAHRSGRVSTGRRMGDVAILDRRDFNIIEEHYDFRAWVIRNRLLAENGDYANQVIWRYKTPPAGLATRAFDTMNQWLTAVESDRSVRTLHEKIVANRPPDAIDSCFRADVAQWSTDAGYCNTGPAPAMTSTVTGSGAEALFTPTIDEWPVYRDTRVAAGEPLTSDIMKCALKPLDRSDYGVTFSASQWSRLQAAFPDGVCDYGKPGIGQVQPVPWQTFMDGPGGRPLGESPRSVSFR